MHKSGVELKFFMRENSRGVTGDRIVARECSREVMGDKIVAREGSRGATGNRMFVRGPLQGAAFRATIRHDNFLKMN